MIVLIAENAGHVKAVSEMTGADLDKDLGRAFMGDGAATTVAGAFGGAGTTTYAENIGVMAATRVYSTAAYGIAALTAIAVRPDARSSACWSARSRPACWAA